MQQRLMWSAIVFGAIFYIVMFFIGEKSSLGLALHLTEIDTGLSRAINVVATMALFLGIINLFMVHGRNIVARRKEWPFSLVVFATFSVVTLFLAWQYRINAQERRLEAQTADAVAAYRAAFSLADPVERDRALQALPPEQVALAGRYFEYQATYRFHPQKFYLDTFISTLAATVMSLLGFYITFAAYRAFRIRSVEATVMMLSAALVILGSDPVGGWVSAKLNELFGAQVVNLVHWADLDNRVANAGMQRGLQIGISVAVIAVSLRILLGLERGLTQAPQAEK